MKKKKLPIGYQLASALISAGLIAHSFAFAAEQDELSLSDIMALSTSATTFFQLDAKKVPGNVFILNSSSLETLPLMRVSNIIELVPGYYINTHQFNGNIVAVRGISVDSSAKTNFILDGVSINQRMHFGYQQSLHSPLFADLKQVEVIKGPGATVYGSGAINGFIAMERHSYLDATQGKVTYTHGFMDKLNRLEAQKGFQFGDKHGLYVYAGAAAAHGEQLTGAVYGSKGYTSVYAGAIPTPDYKLSAKYANHGFSLDNYYERTSYSPGNITNFAPNSTTFGAKGWGYVDKLLVNPKYLLPVMDGQTFELSAPVAFMDYGAVTRGSNAPNLDRGGAENSYSIKGIYRFEKLAQKHNIAVGANYTRRAFLAGRDYFQGIGTDVDPMGINNTQGMDGRWKEYAAFAEDIYSISDKTTAVAGIRFDKQVNGSFGAHYQATGATEINYPSTFIPPNTSSLTGRLAVSHLFDQQNTLKLSYQRGFRAPDANSYLNLGFFNYYLEKNFPQYHMQPISNETVDTYELTYIWETASKKGSLESSVYYNRYNGLIHYHNCPAGSACLGIPASVVANVISDNGFMGQQANAPDAFGSAGFETIYRFNLGDSFKSNGYLSYALSKPVGVTDSTNSYTGLTSTDDKTWSLFPTHSFKADYQFHPLEKLALDTTLIAYGGVKKPNSQQAIQTQYFNGFKTLLNMNLIYQVTNDLGVNVLAQNILNTKKPTAGEDSKPENHSVDTDLGTTVYAGVSYKF